MEIDPRKVTQNGIANVCDLFARLWLWSWDTQCPDRDSQIDRVAAAGRNANEIRADATLLDKVIGTMKQAGMLHPGDDDGEAAYNDALLAAATRHEGKTIRVEAVAAFLKARYKMSAKETKRFLRVLDGAPADGLERACKRLARSMRAPKRDLEGVLRDAVRKTPRKGREELAVMGLRSLLLGAQASTA